MIKSINIINYLWIQTNLFFCFWTSFFFGVFFFDIFLAVFFWQEMGLLLHHLLIMKKKMKPLIHHLVSPRLEHFFRLASALKLSDWYLHMNIFEIGLFFENCHSDYVMTMIILGPVYTTADTLYWSDRRFDQSLTKLFSAWFKNCIKPNLFLSWHSLVYLLSFSLALLWSGTPFEKPWYHPQVVGFSQVFT